MSKVERTLKLDEDAAALLIQLAGSERKQGEFVSALIREKARQDPLLARLAQMEEELARLRREVLRRDAPALPEREKPERHRDAGE